MVTFVYVKLKMFTYQFTLYTEEIFTFMLIYTQIYSFSLNVVARDNMIIRNSHFIATSTSGN